MYVLPIVTKNRFFFIESRNKGMKFGLKTLTKVVKVNFQLTVSILCGMQLEYTQKHAMHFRQVFVFPARF